MKIPTLIKIFISLQFLVEINLTSSENLLVYSKYLHQLKSDELNLLKSVIEWFNRNEMKLAFMNDINLEHEYKRFIDSQSFSQKISKQNQKKVFYLLKKIRKDRTNSRIEKLSKKNIVKKVLNTLININPSRFGK
jgi:hypothetical protein